MTICRNPMTKRQNEILAFIRTYILHNGMPPTRVEISREFGFRSPNAAQEHLKAMAQKRVIELVPTISRGIRVLAP